MSFWGIEVKPGKPVTHCFDRTRGRLRISQATLCIGSVTTRSLVQCNVGNKTPLFLCALLPGKTESCHLDLEFEEAEDVVFSVLGPRSVHLTGYYARKSSHIHVDSDTESYGEDVAHTDTEVSNQSSDEDEYEDSFIDDGEPEVIPASPVSSDGDVVSKGNKKANRKRLKKKHQVIESEDDNTSLESEDEDNSPLPASNDKTSAKNKSSQSGEKSGKETVQVTVHTENSGRGKDDKEEKVDTMDTTMNTNKISKEQLVGDGDDHSDAEPAKSEKPSKKRKKQSDYAKSVEVSGGIEPLAEERPENGPKLKRKKGNKGEKLNESKDSSHGDALKEVKQDAEDTNIGKKLPETTEENKLEASAQGIDANIGVADGCQSAKDHEKKKKKKTKAVNEGAKGSNVESSGMRTLSNGLTIEDLAMGEAEGKVATRGKKVKVYYTGILKENGQVFDSNVGETPYKFRLGDKNIIDGWNIGLEGMCVGEKRRLTIPPSMGYGRHGGGENIPPNSWLIYEIELVGVRG